MLAAIGLRVARRSEGGVIAPDTDIYLADTMGELGLFYRLAGVAFIGGSLTDRGGHNPFEPARLDCAVLHGPDMRNCIGMAAALAAACATEVVADEAELARAVSALLSRPRLRAERCRAGARAAAAGYAVLDAVDERLAPWLDRLAPVEIVDREGAICGPPRLPA
jgi:3-deoxy-D-manno-octulosonic-acid transferase